MSEPLQIPHHFRVQYATNFDRVAQQSESRLRPFMTVVSGLTGEEKTIDRIGTATSRETTGQRFVRTAPTELPTGQRRLRLRTFQAETFKDAWDEKKLSPLILPDGSIITEHGATYNRDIDKIAFNGILGNALELNADGEIESVALPDSQKIAKDYVYTGTATDSVITVAKLLRAKRILQASEQYKISKAVGEAALCIALNAAAAEALLIDASSPSGSRLLSSDAMKPVVNAAGEIVSFLGFNFVYTELVPTETISSQLIGKFPCWVKTGVEFGFWSEITSNVDILPELSHAVQFLSKYGMNATRREDSAVVQIAGVIS